MKRALWFVTSLLALPFCATSQSQDNTPPAITVYTQFDQPYSAASVDEMKRETESIMGPLGLDFSWRSLNGVTGSEVSAELVVVTFKGACRTGDVPLRREGEIGALGWTHMSDGMVLPFSDVDCSKISRFIAPEMRSMDPARQEVLFGKAMGRVLAHELYHVFTNTTHHASWGVAKACYTSHDLVSDHFQFQDKDTRALMGGKLKPLVRRRQATTSFAGGGGGQ
jgi:hypothetical protein